MGTTNDPIYKQLSCGPKGDGSIMGQSGTDPISFYGVTPVAQRAAGSGSAVATTAPTTSTPYGYTTSAQAAAIVTLVNEIRATLVGLGLMVGS